MLEAPISPGSAALPPLSHRSPTVPTLPGGGDHADVSDSGLDDLQALITAQTSVTIPQQLFQQMQAAVAELRLERSELQRQLVSARAAELAASRKKEQVEHDVHASAEQWQAQTAEKHDREMVALRSELQLELGAAVVAAREEEHSAENLIAACEHLTADEFKIVATRLEWRKQWNDSAES